MDRTTVATLVLNTISLVVGVIVGIYGDLLRSFIRSPRLSFRFGDKWVYMNREGEDTQHGRLEALAVRVGVENRGRRTATNVQTYLISIRYRPLDESAYSMLWHDCLPIRRTHIRDDAAFKGQTIPPSAEIFFEVCSTREDVSEIYPSTESAPFEAEFMTGDTGRYRFSLMVVADDMRPVRKDIEIQRDALSPAKTVPVATDGTYVLRASVE